MLLARLGAPALCDLRPQLAQLLDPVVHGQLVILELWRRDVDLGPQDGYLVRVKGMGVGRDAAGGLAARF